MRLHFYRPQRSWGKVIFLQASAILSWGGACSGGGSALVGVPVPGGVPALGGDLLWGVPGPKGGPGPEGGAWWRPPRTSTAAGSKHPTGMHYCFTCNFVKLFTWCDCNLYRYILESHIAATQNGYGTHSCVTSHTQMRHRHTI